MDENLLAQIPMWIFLLLILPFYVVWRQRGNSFTKKKKGQVDLSPNKSNCTEDPSLESGGIGAVVKEIGGTLLTFPLIVISFTLPLVFLYLLVKLVKAMWHA